MKNIIVPFAFGTHSFNTFQKTYYPLFDRMKKEGDVFPVFLNMKAKDICSQYSLEDALENRDDNVLLYALVLSYGKEYYKVEEYVKDYKGKVIVSKPLLYTLEDSIVDYILRRCSKEDVHYVLLAHGSVDDKDNISYLNIQKRLPKNNEILLHHSNKEIKNSKITTLPFMLTEGKHIEQMNEELKQNNAVEILHGGLLEDEIFREVIIKDLCAQKILL